MEKRESTPIPSSSVFCEERECLHTQTISQVLAKILVGSKLFVSIQTLRFF